MPFNCRGHFWFDRVSLYLPNPGTVLPERMGLRRGSTVPFFSLLVVHFSSHCPPRSTLGVGSFVELVYNAPTPVPARKWGRGLFPTGLSGAPPHSTCQTTADKGKTDWLDFSFQAPPATARPYAPSSTVSTRSEASYFRIGSPSAAPTEGSGAGGVAKSTACPVDALGEPQRPKDTGWAKG